MPRRYIPSRNEKCESLRVSLITSQSQIKSTLKRDNLPHYLLEPTLFLHSTTQQKTLTNTNRFLHLERKSSKPRSLS